MTMLEMLALIGGDYNDDTGCFNFFAKNWSFYCVQLIQPVRELS